MNTLNTIVLSLFAFIAAAPAFADQAVLESMLGQVTMKTSAASAAMKARPGMTLPRGSELSTAKNSRAIVRFNATDVVRLGPNTRLLVAEVNQNSPAAHDTVLRVVFGSVRAMLNRVGAKRQ